MRGERGLDVGDRVRVQLTGVDVERGFIDFVARALTPDANWIGRRLRFVSYIPPAPLSNPYHLVLPVRSAAPARAPGGLRRRRRRVTLTSGEAIFSSGCAGCHGPHGEGEPQTTIGFDKPSTFPDFTDCASTTPELDVDWKATITHGGHGRGFSRIMPAFAEALTPAADRRR